ncbi:hypothetical protein L336_1029 [Candidatus Saccharimonas aalborgensis]|uniref:Uncharacterized protein n=1 Tax=Candidatus Saccharimonas aalborgensis TaxID=1332188 RepID=R4PM86_9BACT|nr:hypothetical protein [Candidatus Saccharimonas aalborgensis]AGL62728.1 hypothetical protein L336_1029 [Candidatus Saccharimonas aalborgensis]QQR51494.1 MAG: hypothetical protein IPF89_01515 [Candidatus Saccharibacteria bacterium]QQS68227.1 MAG: hypothetical protein IPP24_04435 [Candidatus Saccharibacteria bacterium]QQS70550.1 MAG: hypothetical protein IPP92_04440 [Candidatus Saccharibacteria bacterium]
MATPKKKTTPKKRPVSVKKTVVRKVSVAQQPTVRTFKRSHPSDPFFTFRMTHQTLYWFILCAMVLGLGLWVISINEKVQQIYDQIDQTNAAADATYVPLKVKK